MIFKVLWYVFRWSLIAGRLPGRTDNEVKIHWETYLKRKLIKMGIDPTNHRLYHHTNYITRRYLNSSHKENETNTISDRSSSVSDSCDMTLLPISTCLEDITSTGQYRLPDLNIGLIPVKTVNSLPGFFLQDSGGSSNNDSACQETLLLFRWKMVYFGHLVLNPKINMVYLFNCLYTSCIWCYITKHMITTI